LKSRLEAMLQLEHVGDVRCCGMVGGIELVLDKTSRAPYPWEERTGVRVCLEAKKEGIFLRPLGNVIVVFPPLAISMDELVFLLDGVERSIRAVTGTK